MPGPPSHNAPLTLNITVHHPLNHQRLTYTEHRRPSRPYPCHKPNTTSVLPITKPRQNTPLLRRNAPRATHPLDHRPPAAPLKIDALTVPPVVWPARNGGLLGHRWRRWEGGVKARGRGVEVREAGVSQLRALGAWPLIVVVVMGLAVGMCCAVSGSRQ